MLYETFIKEYVALYQIFFFVQPCAFANSIAPDTGKDKEIQKFFYRTSRNINQVKRGMKYQPLRRSKNISSPLGLKMKGEQEINCSHIKQVSFPRMYQNL